MSVKIINESLENRNNLRQLRKLNDDQLNKEYWKSLIGDALSGGAQLRKAIKPVDAVFYRDEDIDNNVLIQIQGEIDEVRDEAIKEVIRELEDALEDK